MLAALLTLGAGEVCRRLAAVALPVPAGEAAVPEPPGNAMGVFAVRKAWSDSAAAAVASCCCPCTREASSEYSCNSACASCTSRMEEAMFAMTPSTFTRVGCSSRVALAVTCLRVFKYWRACPVKPTETAADARLSRSAATAKLLPCTWWENW